MRTTFTFNSAGQLVFGRDAVLQLRAVVRRLVASRVFVITDSVLAKAGVVERVRAAIAAAHVEVAVFEGGVPEPPLSLAEACETAARQISRATQFWGWAAAAIWTWPRSPPRC